MVILYLTFDEALAIPTGPSSTLSSLNKTSELLIERSFQFQVDFVI